MSAPIVSAIGHVALRVQDLEAALWTATHVMGLREVERVGEWVYLTHGSPHHTLQLAPGAEGSVEHIGLEVEGEAGLAALRARLEQASIPVLESASVEPGLGDAVSFVGPEGFVFEAYVGMAHDQPPFVPMGVRPTRFGHVNIYLEQPQAMVDFLQEILDFRISDYVGPGAFLRCNADHHGIGVGQAEPTRIHHMAWEVEGIADLARLGDVLNDHDRHLLWGPVRHGVGRNIAAYFVDFGGLIVEYYCGMQQIHNDAEFVPAVWQRDDPRFYSLWARHDLPEFRDHGLPVAKRA